MIDVLYCGFWSILGGLLSALVISCALLLLSIRLSDRGTIGLIQLTVSTCLFCLLFYQFTLLFGALGYKSVTLEVISDLYSQLDQRKEVNEVKDSISAFLNQNAIIPFFIDPSLLEDLNNTDSLSALKEAISEEYNAFILRRIYWILSFLAVASTIVIFFTKNRAGRKRIRNRKRLDDSQFSEYF